MKEKEKQLFRALCSFKNPEFDPELTEAATPVVLGHLFFNRMQGVAYDVLQKHGLLGKVNREFRNSLASAYEQNAEKNRSFFRCVGMLSEILATCHSKVAMLKGAYLCAHYPDGYRTSNDVDLLVSPEDVTAVGRALADAGFRQGNVRGGTFIPATRREIIESKMMRGETVPYIKEVNLPFMKFFEVDINFSLDYKNDDGKVLSDMLSRTCVMEEKGIAIPTLEQADFFLHLCAHLYKEATTLPWIEMHRDMTLYKYCDIYMLLSEMNEGQLFRIFKRAKELEMEKICAYAILETAGLFDIADVYALHKAEEALADDPDFCLRVTSPQEKKTLIYNTCDAGRRFFMESRAEDLREVKSDEKT